MVTRLPLILKEGVAGLRSLFYPPHCAACGCRLECEDSLCGECRGLIFPLPGRVCPICSHPLWSMAPCPNCEGRRWHLSVIVSGCRHEGLVRDLIHRFKYGRDQSLVRPLGELLFPSLLDPRLAGRSFDAVVPVPLHPLREREREFNQAALLASRLGKHAGIPVAHLLRRSRQTGHQARFDRRERLANMNGVFLVRKGVPSGASLLLVDDVVTTGTTLDACAAALLLAGASEVCAVTVARG